MTHTIPTNILQLGEALDSARNVVIYFATTTSQYIVFKDGDNIYCKSNQKWFSEDRWFNLDGKDLSKFAIVSL